MDLYILVTSDVHGYIMPTDYIAGSVQTNLGLAKAAGVVQAVRNEHEHVVYIDNGDLIQGSALAQYLALRQREKGPLPIIGCLNDMGCDVAIVGNHEFNYGMDYLNAGVKAAKFPFISANIIDKNRLKPYFSPYTIIERGGVRIAVLGLVTSFIPHWEKPEHISGLYFESPVESAKRWVPYLKSIADLVIVSYHGGFDRDPFSGKSTIMQKGENEGLDILNAVPDIDCLIVGHQHREIAGVYRNIPIVMPGWRAQTVGLVHLLLKKDEKERWRVNAHEATLLRNGRVKPDETILAEISALHNEVEEWLDYPIGEVEGDMTITDPIVARSRLHPYVEFINRIQMEVSGAGISCTSIFRGDSKGLPKEITVRNIVNNYIYANTLAVLRVSGADLRAALERCARFFDIDETGNLTISEEFSKPFIQYYNYDIYSGIDYVMDVRKPAGERIIKLEYQGRPVANDDELKVVMNNYRAIGGGAYPMYKREKIVKDIQIDMTDLLVDYIIEQPLIKAEEGNGFKVIY